MARSLGEHDPYRNMQTGGEAIYSDYEKNAGKKPGAGGSVDGTSALNTDLAEAEKAAAKKVDDWSDLENDDIKTAEEGADGFYSGSGRGEGKLKATGLKGLAKKGGPFFAILFIIFGAGGIMTGTQVFQPFSLVAQFEEVYNSMRVSANIRSEKLFRVQMSKNRKVKSPYNIFGTKLSISDRQKQKLKEQGIEYDNNYKGERALLFKDKNGDIIPVTAKNFREIYTTNPDFFHSYNAGSMTWRGSIANWFGTNMRNFLSTNKLTRNMFEKYKEKMDGIDGSKMSELEKQKKVVQDTMNEKIKEEGDLRIKVADDSEETDADGNGTGRNNVSEASFDRKVKTKTEVRDMMNNVAGKYGGGANLACAAFNAFGAINLLVTAHQALQIMNLTTSFFEVVDKTKAGLGDEAPLMAYSNALNERFTSSNVIVENSGDDLDSVEAVEVIRDRTAMESAGIASIYGNGPADPSDPSVASFNITNNMKNVFGGLGISMASFKACTVARMATAALSLGTSLLCLTGFGCFAKVFEGISHLDLLKSAGVAVLISFMVPTVADIMQRDIIKDLAGENFGNALAMGALMYLGSSHRANGGSLSSIKKYKKFAVEQSQVIAENAKYERESLSPFDITSKYTFMGTLLTQMMSFTHANSVMSTLTAGGSALHTSLIGMTDSASAYGIAEKLPDSIDDYAGTCPYLASINAVGDSFCNPYVISDTATMDKDPDDVLAKLQERGNFSSDSGDNVTIDGNSDLAKYIKYCDNRQSAFGIADQNIAGEVAGTGDVNTDNGTVNAISNSIIGMIPFIGDAIDIIQSVEERNNIGYISGESCVAGNTVDAASSPNWSKAKYYQRFIEDQSLAESMGLIEKSAVTAYLEDYYKEHPLDNTYEGILARYSGLTKDNVIALLDFIDYAKFVANYDPSDSYAFGASVKPAVEIHFEQENVMSGDGVLLGHIIYADVRNRSFAV